MKPVPRSYGVSGELKPVKPNSYGVVNMVSVLMSVADPASPLSLLHTQLDLEAEVGIGQFTVYLPLLFSHKYMIFHQ